MNMKLAIATLAISTVMLVSCKSEEEKVADIAQDYLEAVTNYHVSEAKEYASEEFMPILETMTYFMSVTPKEQLDATLPNEITINKTLLKADTAIVYFHSKNPSTECDAQLKMIKTNGEWLVYDQGETVK